MIEARKLTRGPVQPTPWGRGCPIVLPYTRIYSGLDRAVANFQSISLPVPNLMEPRLLTGQGTKWHQMGNSVSHTGHPDSVVTLSFECFNDSLILASLFFQTEGTTSIIISIFGCAVQIMHHYVYSVARMNQNQFIFDSCTPVSSSNFLGPLLSSHCLGLSR